jgi:hypothetical protein
MKEHRLKKEVQNDLTIKCISIYMAQPWATMRVILIKNFLWS